MPDNTPTRIENPLDKIVAPRGRTFTEIGNMLRFASESDRRAFRDYLTAADDETTAPEGAYRTADGGYYRTADDGYYLTA